MIDWWEWFMCNLYVMRIVTRWVLTFVPLENASQSAEEQRQ
jgi:hypothetical protein